MKQTLLTTLLAVAMLVTGLADEKEVYRDNLLEPRYGGYEHCSLGEIYLALPQQLFECTFQQRIERLIQGDVQFKPDKKEIYFPGDGGQMTLTVQVLVQTKDKLVLSVLGESEGKVAWKLERIPGGWNAEVKFIE